MPLHGAVFFPNIALSKLEVSVALRGKPLQCLRGKSLQCLRGESLQCRIRSSKQVSDGAGRYHLGLHCTDCIKELY